MRTQKIQKKICPTLVNFEYLHENIYPPNDDPQSVVRLRTDSQPTAATTFNHFPWSKLFRWRQQCTPPTTLSL